MKKITRRSFLSATGIACVSAALAACGAESSSAAASSSSVASSSVASSSEAASAQTIFTLEDLAGKTVGVQLGTTGDIYVSGDESLGLAGVEQFNKGSEAVQALLVGKLDAVVIDDQVAMAFVDANADKLTILEMAYAEEDYAACISKDNSDLTEAFNGAIAELKTDGTLDAILEKYIDKVDGAPGYVSEVTEYPNGKLVMGTNAYFPPYEYYEGDNIVGVDAEFAKAICDKLGYELEIADMEFDSIIMSVNSGKADFGMAGMTVTEDRLKNVDFTETYCTGIQAVVVLK